MGKKRKEETMAKHEIKMFRVTVISKIGGLEVEQVYTVITDNVEFIPEKLSAMIKSIEYMGTAILL